MLPLLLFLLALTPSHAQPAAGGTLTVSIEPAADGASLASARAGGWGAPPLGPGTVTFVADGVPPASGDVHLGLAQAVLRIPCGRAVVVTGTFASATGGPTLTGDTVAPARAC